MKILLLSLNFHPELTGIGKYSGEMAAWLAAKGHEVRVVAAPPYYPAWSVSNEYSSWRYKREEWCQTVVFRCPVWIPRNPGGLARILHLLSFSFLSIPVVLFNLVWRPSLVWVVAPPLVNAPLVLFFAGFFNYKTWLHIQDFEVDAAFELGLLKGRRTKKIAIRIESFLLGRFDCVSSISKKMLNLAAFKGVADKNAFLLPNWVDSNDIRPLGRSSSFRKQLSLKDDVVVALYSGNMGNKQGLEILERIARLMKDDSSVFFVFCGDGSGKVSLENSCRDLTNVCFLPLQPKALLSELLGLADIHLLPQRAGAADLVMPSKLTGMLASGKAIIATAEIDTEVAELLELRALCGIVVPPGDAAAFVGALKDLASDPSRREEMGKLGRSYAERELSIDKILESFQKRIELLV